MFLIGPFLSDADIDLVVLGAGPTTTEGGGGYNRHDREDLVKILRKISKALQTGRVVQKATAGSIAWAVHGLIAYCPPCHSSL